MKNMKLWDWVVWNQRLKTKIKWKIAPKLLSILCHQNFLFFFLSMYEMGSFPLFTANPWRKNNVEVIEYGGKIWINQGHLQEEVGIAKKSDRNQYYPDEFKKWDAKYKSVVNIKLAECLLKILWQ